MNDPLITVIIPVYNVAPWLAECLDSVLAQDYKALEIICVNDGSTDDSQFILDKYAIKDQRIRLMSHENHGLGFTRNRAIENANGKYIFCLDSDDKIKEGFLSSLIERAETDDLDMLCYDMESFFESKSLQRHHRHMEKHHVYNYPGIWDGRKLFAEMQHQNDYYCAAWLALYRTEWLRENNIRFTEGILHEDELFVFSCFLKSDRVGFSPERGYLYRLREGSIMTGEKSMAHLTGLYRTANLMAEVCFQNRDRLINYQEFYDYSLHIKHAASYFYRHNEDVIMKQRADGFEQMIIEDLKNYGSRAELEDVYNSTSWKIGQAIVNPLFCAKSMLKRVL